MTTRILCVDDDPKLLAGLRRILHGKIEHDIAIGPEVALDAVRDKGPYAVVVADMQMPGMDGTRFLSRLREISPDTVRILLTGDSDVTTAARAINEVDVHRFLSKPCPPEVFLAAVRSGIDHHNLLVAERDILERTVAGCVRSLLEVLALSNPEIHARACTVRDWALRVARQLRVDTTWEIEIAAMLLHVGWLTLPESLSAKHVRAEPLGADEQELVDRLPSVSAALIAAIPRLEVVAEIVRRHREEHESQVRVGALPVESVPIGASILRAVTDLAYLLARGGGPVESVAALHLTRGKYSPAVLAALVACTTPEEKPAARAAQPNIVSLPLGMLAIGHRVAEDVSTLDGRLLMRADMKVSGVLLQRLLSYDRLHGVRQPIRVEVAEAPQPAR